MNIDQLNELHDLARSFKATKAQFDAVAETLANSDRDDIRKKCILILRYEASASREMLVAKFLKSSDVDIVDEALRFLIRDILAKHSYDKELIQVLDDKYADEFLLLTAVQLSGESYIREKNNLLLGRILDFVEDTNQALQASAKASLIIALTPHYRSMSPAARDVLRGQRDIEPYRQRAQAILKE